MNIDSFQMGDDQRAIKIDEQNTKTAEENVRNHASNGLFSRLKETGKNVISIISDGFKRVEREEQARDAKGKFFNYIEKLKDPELEEAERNEMVEWCEEFIRSYYEMYDEQNERYSDEIKEAFLKELQYMEDEFNKVKGSSIYPVDAPVEISTPDIIPVASESNLDSEPAPSIPEPINNESNDDTIIPDDSEDITDLFDQNEDVEEEPEVEIPVVSESELSEEQEDEPEIESEEESSIDLSDYTQFEDYREYLIAYRQARIDVKDIDTFYNDFREGKLPSDLLDEQSFKTQKQKIEYDIEYRKLEDEKAETEKQLREIEERQAALNEEHDELQRRFEDREAKLASMRSDNVSLKQELVDQKGIIKDQSQEISDLRGQVDKASEAAKQAQAKAYDADKACKDLEKELEKDRKRVAELEEKLANSERERAEVQEELKQTKDRISKNTEEAVKQLNNLRAEDDLEKAAIAWKKSKIEGKTIERKKGPRFKAEDSAETQKPEIEEKSATISEPEVSQNEPVSVDEQPTLEETHDNSPEIPSYAVDANALDEAVAKSMEITDSERDRGNISPEELAANIEWQKNWDIEHPELVPEESVQEEMPKGKHARR